MLLIGLRQNWFRRLFLLMLALQFSCLENEEPEFPVLIISEANGISSTSAQIKAYIFYSKKSTVIESGVLINLNNQALNYHDFSNKIVFEADQNWDKINLKLDLLASQTDYNVCLFIKTSDNIFYSRTESLSTFEEKDFSVTGIFPDSATINDTITIFGKGFGLINPNLEVKIGTRSNYVLELTDTLMSVIVPSLDYKDNISGFFDISVIRNGKKSTLTDGFKLKNPVMVLDKIDTVTCLNYPFVVPITGYLPEYTKIYYRTELNTFEELYITEYFPSNQFNRCGSDTDCIALRIPCLNEETTLELYFNAFQGLSKLGAVHVAVPAIDETTLDLCFQRDRFILTGKYLDFSHIRFFDHNQDLLDYNNTFTILSSGIDFVELDVKHICDQEINLGMNYGSISKLLGSYCLKNPVISNVNVIENPNYFQTKIEIDVLYNLSPNSEFKLNNNHAFPLEKFIQSDSVTRYVMGIPPYIQSNDGTVDLLISNCVENILIESIMTIPKPMITDSPLQVSPYQIVKITGINFQSIYKDIYINDIKGNVISSGYDFITFKISGQLGKYVVYVNIAGQNSDSVEIEVINP